MKKRTLLMALSLLAAVLVGTTGTLAYLSDTDEDVNVMTLGNVQIDQFEMQRVDPTKHTGKAEEGALEAFEYGQPLYPAYPVNGAATDYTAEATELYYWGDYVTAENAGNGLWNPAKIKGTLDKMVFVKNTGTSEAYFRTWIAFECPEGMTFGDAAYDHIGANTNSRYDETDVGFATIKVDGKDVRFAVYCFNYGEVLAAGETARPSLLQLAMNHNCGNEEMAKLGETYEVLVLTQACQTENFPDANTALTAAFGEATLDNHPWKDREMSTEPKVEYTGDPAELHKLLTEATDAGSGDQTLALTENYDMTGYDWTPIKVDGYHGADIVTIEGNGCIIKGLKAPLFAGGFAGGSGIVIKDLTIADSQIVSANTLGSGAFIESMDSMSKIELTNCHLKNSSVKGSRTGGLMGWNAGYNNQNDGPVDSIITVENCSVVGCTIEGSSVGGILGHAGNNPATFNTIKNCTVKDCELKSSDAGEWRVGVVVGTANVGEVVIEKITESGNTLTQTGKTAPAGQSNLYGRLVPGTTGKLTIDGVEIK